MDEGIRKACRGCGKPFDRWQSWSTNSGMANSRCRECYLAYTRRRQSPLGDRRPPPIDASVPVYGVRPTGRPWRRLRAEVLASETHCGICGEWVDQSLSHTSKMGPTVDHILPLALGGATYDRNNLRLAHRSCNSKGGAAVANDRLSLARAAVWLGSRL